MKITSIKIYIFNGLKNDHFYVWFWSDMTWTHFLTIYNQVTLQKFINRYVFKLIESSCISYLPLLTEKCPFRLKTFEEMLFYTIFTHRSITWLSAKGSMKETPMLEIEMRCQNLVTMVKTWYIHRFQARRVIKHPYMRWSHKQAYAEYCMWQFWFWHHIHYKI